MIKTLFVFAFSVSLFASGKGDFSFRKINQSSQPVSCWLLNDETVPLINQHLQTVPPVVLKARELLIRDLDSGLFIIQNPTEDELKYSLHLSSGKVLSEFSRRWDLDLPLPQILIDSPRKRLISLDQNGQLSARTFSGERLWQRVLKTEPVFTYENAYATALNMENGEITAAISQPLKEGDLHWQTRVFKASSQGNVLNERVFNNSRLVKMDMKKDGNRTVLMLILPGADDQGKKQIQTLVLDGSLTTLWESDFQFRKALFADKDHLLLMGKNKTRFINIKTGQVLWDLKETERIFDSAVLTQKNNVFLISGRPDYINGKLFYRDTHIYQTDCFKFRFRKTQIPEAEFIPGNIRQTPSGNLELGGRKGIYLVPGRDGDK